MLVDRSQWCTNIVDEEQERTQKQPVQCQTWSWRSDSWHAHHPQSVIKATQLWLLYSYTVNRAPNIKCDSDFKVIYVSVCIQNSLQVGCYYPQGHVLMIVTEKLMVWRTEKADQKGWSRGVSGLSSSSVLYINKYTETFCGKAHSSGI